MTTKAIEVVSATRLSREDFIARSALGISLQRLGDERITASIAFQNRAGLPAVYNHRIERSSSRVLLFVHDDVWLDDIFLADRRLDAVTRYDIVGVAGNTRCADDQASWAFVDDALTWDAEAHLSGAIANGIEPFGRISRFGPSPAACRLLDGVFLATRVDALRDADVRFDEQFAFHCYDSDVCRTAHARGLRIGTWPVSITHQSGGRFRSDGWRDAARRFRRKWAMASGTTSA